jgi:preprotein translocase subunit SecG
MVTFLFYLTITLFIIVCLFMVLLILIQKGRGGGLASAFGGAGGNTAFGSKTGDVLTWATSVVFGVFVLLAVVLNLFANARHDAAAATASNAANTTPAAPVRGPLNDAATPDPVLPPGGTPVERPSTQP